MKSVWLVVLTIWAALPAHALDFQWNGNFKSIYQWEQVRNNVSPREARLLSEQRLRLSNIITGQHFRTEFAVQGSAFLQQPNQPTVNLPSFPPPPAWDANYSTTQSESGYLTGRVDRLNLETNLGELQLILGKQVVANGVGQLFQAVSQVPRQPFVVVDPEFPLTEDALTVVWRGPFVLETRFLPKTRTQQTHNFTLRAKGNKDGYDVALTAGRSDDKSYVGFETAGNLGESLVRGEVVGYDTNGTQAVQALAGFDRALSRTWTFSSEFFYNGLGAAGAGELPNISHRPSPYRNRVYLGFQLGWDITARLKSKVFSIANLNDRSLLTHATLSYSFSGNLEFMAGHFFGLSSQAGGEFGGRLNLAPTPYEFGLPDLTYGLVKFYF